MPTKRMRIIAGPNSSKRREYRIVQDRLFESDFDRLIKGELEERGNL